MITSSHGKIGKAGKISKSTKGEVIGKKRGVGEEDPTSHKA